MGKTGRIEPGSLVRLKTRRFAETTPETRLHLDGNPQRGPWPCTRSAAPRAASQSTAQGGRLAPFYCAVHRKD